MTRRTWRKMIRGLFMTAASGLVLMTSCVADVTIPGGRVEVDRNGVFVTFLGLVVDVTPGAVLIDIPGVEVDLHH